MKKLHLHIKGMVCPRCETVIQLELETLGAKVITIQAGYALVDVPTSVDQDLIAQKLHCHGFALLDDPEQKLLEQIKTATLDYLYHQQHAALNRETASAMSDFLAHAIGRSYSHLSKLFSTHEGRTLEQYYIHLRIARVKALLDDGELNVSEIAHTLGYSSGHYLSAQFKKVTGRSVSDYRKNSEGMERNYLNEL